jgi:hypothetical protein
MTRLFTIVLSLLIAAVVVVSPAAAPDRKPPRIVAATMLDVDGDARADRVRLTYSERVRHPADIDGRYPFTVSGYRIAQVGKATGKTLAILLVEQAQPDPEAAPTIRYRRVRQQPVRDRAGNQALGQLFSGAKSHGQAPASPPGPADTDRDGTSDADDCAPRDASTHPGAPDLPDLSFVDSNCDGIDGTEKDAVFVSPNGNDQNPGTKERPKREVALALLTAAKNKKPYVLVAFGSYGPVALVTGVSVFGGYDPASWTRRDRFPGPGENGLPRIKGVGEAVIADGAKDVILQHLSFEGTAGAGTGASAYGIRAINDSSLTLQRVVVNAGNATAGAPGANGQVGAPGADGGQGGAGSCDGARGFGGRGGSSVAARPGGDGGIGGSPDIAGFGFGGFAGKVDTPGGAGGAKGNPGRPGQSGQNGALGDAGSPGAGASNSAASAGKAWTGKNGLAGGDGNPGNGGGGGGGGGAQQGTFADNGGGNGGGGGGGGGAGGTGGRGGLAGGGSFGIYLVNSKVVVEASRVAAQNGGSGGRGGDGGRPGAGGKGGRGGRVCTSEIGAGGNGGAGGAGGRAGGGGGGAGGPSVGIFKLGTATLTVKDGSTVKAAPPGAGGAGGASGPGGAGKAGEAGIARPVFP